MVRLDAILDSWNTARQDTAAAVEDMPAGDMDFKPAPELMSFRQIAHHILEASHGITGLILAGEENLSGPEFREKIKAHFTGLPQDASQSAVAAELRRATAQRIEELRGRPAEWYAGMVTRVDGQRVTRQEMLLFVKEHELTHRSQMFVYLRLKGVIPATTRRRQAAQTGR